MPNIPAAVSDRVGPQWFDVETNAGHTYCDGEGEGSLKDLVLQEYGTKYPRGTAELWPPEEGVGRARRGVR